MKKKWYDLFVVTQQPVDDKNAPSRPVSNAQAGPKRAGELAPEPVDESSFARPVDDPTVLADIYAAAKIVAPSHGYSILKVAEMLASEHLRDLPANVKQKSILVALDAAGVSVDSMVADAVQRDRALDTYQSVLERSLGELRANCEAENRQLEVEIERQIAQLRARIDENQQRVQKDEADLASWRAQKQMEENRIAEAVNYFVSENPISTAQPLTPQGGGHVGQDL